MDKTVWSTIQDNKPIIHSISNFVTANDNANILLALGASPIMADEPQEMADITTISHATVLNIGTPSDLLFEACRLAGLKANELEHPLIIDPVGVGASAYRRLKMLDLLTEVQPTIIRANVGEVETLVGLEGKARGVDSESGSEDTSRRAADQLAETYGCTVFMTGETDYITDGVSRFIVQGGNERIQNITGTGCMLSVITGAVATAEKPVEAAVHAAYAWKVCAEIAAKKNQGIGEMHTDLFNLAENITEVLLYEHHVKIEEVTVE